MTTQAGRVTTSRDFPTAIKTSTRALGKSLWARVLLSRLLAVSAGTVGALYGPERSWQAFDPQHLTLSLGRVGDVLAASVDRWDAVHYLQIAHSGYADPRNAVFFPFYPLLIHVVAWLVRSDFVAGVLISLVAFMVALELVRRLAVEELGERSAQAAVLLLAFAPLSFFFTAIYTESLFLALSAGAFYLGRQGRFGFAALAGAAAALTHLEGVLLAVPLGVMYWEQPGARPRRLAIRVRDAATLALPALAPLAFIAYLRTQGFGLLAAFADQSSADNDGHHFTGPVITLVQAISATASSNWQTFHASGSLQSWVTGAGLRDTAQLFVVAISLVALVAAGRRLPIHYAVYCGLALIVFTSSPAADDPLESIDRFVLVLFPLWMVAAAWLSERRLLGKVLLIGGLLLCFYSFEYARWMFVA